jgi:hypothetical protein
MAATETTIQVVYLSVPASCLQSGTLEFLPFRRTTISLVRRGYLGLVATIGEAPNEASTDVLKSNRTSASLLTAT